MHATAHFACEEMRFKSIVSGAITYKYTYTLLHAGMRLVGVRCAPHGLSAPNHMHTNKTFRQLSRGQECAQTVEVQPFNSEHAVPCFFLYVKNGMNSRT
jgi:hypothetical protein